MQNDGLLHRMMIVWSLTPYSSDRNQPRGDGLDCVALKMKIDYAALKMIIVCAALKRMIVCATLKMMIA